MCRKPDLSFDLATILGWGKFAEIEEMAEIEEISKNH